MGSWSFVSNHGRVLLFLADDPGMRLHDIAARLRITERSAHGIMTDLTAAGYISKHKDGRRDRYQIVTHQPLPEPITREKTFREVLAVLPGAAAGQPLVARGRR
jgi:predicted transcriptional regulator